MTHKTSKHFHRLFLLVLSAFALIAIVGGAIFGNLSPALINSASAADHTLNYTVDRSQLPQMNYYTLTYDIYVGTVSTVEVKTSGGNIIPSTYSTDTVTFTTDEVAFNLTLNEFTGPTENIGNITIAPLKDHKLWAWSHGFDDNDGFLKDIYELEQFGMPATLYLNDNNRIPDPEVKPNPTNPYDPCDINTTECYSIGKTKLIQLLETGWAIGNHTENHFCWSNDTNPKPSDEILWQDILDVETKLKNKIIAPSNRPNYIINSFAAPCFNNYNDLIQSKISNNETEIIMSEGSHIVFQAEENRFAPYEASNNIPLQGGFAFSNAIVRDFRLQPEQERDEFNNLLFEINGDRKITQESIDTSITFLKSVFDWHHENSSKRSPEIYWYNSISHGGYKTNQVFSDTLPYLINTYGPNSIYDEVWLATAEEVYSYIYAKEKTTISLLCSSTIGSCNQNPVQTPDIVPSSTQIYGRVFNDANENGLDDNEVGIAGVDMIYWIDSDCDGELQYTVEEYGGEVSTNADGSYLFTGLNPNYCYKVQIDHTTISGYSLTATNSGANDNIDNDFMVESQNNIFTEKIILPAPFVNAGLIQTDEIPTPMPTTSAESNQISGRVFNDLNRNGIDDNEPGIEGVRLNHWIDWECDGIDFNDPNSYQGDLTSGSDGSYQFMNLDMNPQYCHLLQLVESTASGFTLTTLNIGDDSKDSDFDPVNGYTPPFQLPEPNVSAGLYDPTLPTPIPSETPIPNQTPPPTATPVPSPTPLPTNISDQVIFANGQLNPDFVTDYTQGTQFKISNNNLEVAFQNDNGFLSLRHWQEATSNVVALNFDVRSASIATRVLFRWIDEKGNILADNAELLKICPGNYLITQNIPEQVSGFTLQEYSGERLTVEHHTFELDNISFLIQNDTTPDENIVFSAPECPIYNSYLPMVVR